MTNLLVAITAMVVTNQEAVSYTYPICPVCKKTPNQYLTPFIYYRERDIECESKHKPTINYKDISITTQYWATIKYGDLERKVLLEKPIAMHGYLYTNLWVELK